MSASTVLLAGARIDAQHLAGADLGRDDEALRVELDRIGHAQVLRDHLGLAAVEAHPPDLVRPLRGEIELAVRPDFEGVGHRHVVEDHPRFAGRLVEFADPPAHAQFAGDHPVLVGRHRVRHRYVAVEHPGGAVGMQHGELVGGDFGAIEIAGGIEGEIVRAGDAAAHRADRLDIAGVGIDRRDLAAADLRHIDPPVLADLQPVGAMQPAGRGEALQRPASASVAGAEM